MVGVFYEIFWKPLFLALLRFLQMFPSAQHFIEFFRHSSPDFYKHGNESSGSLKGKELRD